MQDSTSLEDADHEWNVPDAFPAAFGDFVLGKKIGEGGFGVVFRAVNALDGTACAVKFLRPARTADPKARDRFRGEFELLAALDHPNCIAVHSMGEAGGTPYFVMELVDGVDAGQLAGVDRRVPPLIAADVIRQAALGCHHAHTRDRPVVHRDVKPKNILVEARSGRAVLTDFGLSKALQPGASPSGGAADACSTLRGRQPGTLAYMAPEQTEARLGAVGPRSDVYSLGATMYELLTGRRPFPLGPRADEDTTAYEIRWRSPRRFKNLGLVGPAAPPRLEKICRICLQKHPHDRYRTAADLAADLDRFARGVPLRGRLPTPVRRLRNAVSRQRELAAAAAALLVALAVSLALNWRTAADNLALTRSGRAKDGAVSSAAARAAAATRQAWDAQRLADANAERTREESAGRRWAQYGSDVLAVGGYWEAGNHERAKELVERYAGDDAADLRGPEWLYWRARLRRLPHVYRAPSDARSAAVARGGRAVAVTTDRRLYVWKAGVDAPDVDVAIAERPPSPVLSGRDESVAFSPDGRYVAAVAVDAARPPDRGTLTLWDVRAGRLARRVGSPWIGGRSVLFAPGGRAVVASAVDGGIVHVDVATGAATHHPCSPTAPVKGGATNEMTFVGGRLVTLNPGDDPMEWDPKSWEFWRTLRPGLPRWNDTRGSGSAACESTLFAQRLRSATVPKWADGTPDPWWSVFPRLRANRRLTACAAGRRYLEGREDGSVHVFTFGTETHDIADAEEVVIRGHTSPVSIVTATEDGMLSADEGGAVVYRPWSRVPDGVTVTLAGGPPQAGLGGWRPDGASVERASRTSVTVTDAAGADSIPCPAGTGQVDLSPTGRYLYFHCMSRAREPSPVWDRTQRRAVAALPPLGFPGYQAAAFAADESHLAVAASPGYVAVVGLPGGEVSRVECGGPVTYCGISPGGRFVGVGAAGRSGVFDRHAGRWVYETPSLASVFAFSPGTRYGFVGTRVDAADPVAAVVDLSSGTCVPTAFGRTSCNEFDFSADGRRAYLRHLGWVEVYDAHAWRALARIDGSVPDGAPLAPFVERAAAAW